MGRKAYETPPELTYEQRMAGLSKAVEVRKQRKAMKALIQRGDVSPGQALDADAAQGMRITTFLDACPGIGPANRERALRECGISYKHRVGGLGKRQKERLREWLDKNSYVVPNRE